MFHEIQATTECSLKRLYDIRTQSVFLCLDILNARNSSFLSWEPLYKNKPNILRYIQIHNTYTVAYTESTKTK